MVLVCEDFSESGRVFAQGVKMGELAEAVAHIKEAEVNAEVVAVWSRIARGVLFEGLSVADAAADDFELVGPVLAEYGVVRRKASSVVEVAGPGRQPIGDPVVFRPGEELLQAVDRFAKENSMKRPEAIRVLLQSSLFGDVNSTASSVEQWLQERLLYASGRDMERLVLENRGGVLAVVMFRSSVTHPGDSTVKLFDGFVVDDVMACARELVGADESEQFFEGSFVLPGSSRTVRLVGSNRSSGTVASFLFLPERSASLEELRVLADQREVFRRLLSSSGAVMLGGGAGSGKTTLMAALAQEYADAGAAVSFLSASGGFVESPVGSTVAMPYEEEEYRKVFVREMGLTNPSVVFMQDVRSSVELLSVVEDVPQGVPSMSAVHASSMSSLMGRLLELAEGNVQLLREVQAFACVRLLRLQTKDGLVVFPLIVFFIPSSSWFSNMKSWREKDGSILPQAVSDVKVADSVEEALAADDSRFIVPDVDALASAFDVSVETLKEELSMLMR